MKAINIAIIILVAAFPIMSHSQILQENFTGITWKVRELYVNNVKYQNEAIESLRYHFKPNGILEFHKPQSSEKATINYTFNAVESTVTLEGENLFKTVLRLIYADKRNLVYTSSSKDKNTGELLISEFRMVPE